jgi:hypothetical protein
MLTQTKSPKRPVFENVVSVPRLSLNPTPLEVLVLADGFDISEATLKWLLEPDNPSVRLNTLHFLLDRSEHELDVLQSAEPSMFLPL